MSMSPEVIISALARLNALLEAKYEEQKVKDKKFRQLQMMLAVLSFSVGLVLFITYSASLVQMIFILVAFNVLFFVGFKPRALYSEKKVKAMMKKVLAIQVALKRFLMDEVVSFDGVQCSAQEGWVCDKWGVYKGDERIDYSEFLYDKHIKGLYLQALRNKK